MEQSKDVWKHGRPLEGKTVVVTGQGPSFNRHDAQELEKHFPILAVKDTFNWFKKPYLIYACDLFWWEKYWADTRSIKANETLFVGYDKEVHTHAFKDKMHFVAKGADHHFCYTEGYVGHGYNSGHQAINLAINLGAKKIILLGFDMCSVGGLQHYPECNHASIPEENFIRWREELVQAAKTVPEGVTIVNTSLTSALKCFPQLSVRNAIYWGLQS